MYRSEITKYLVGARSRKILQKCCEMQLLTVFTAIFVYHLQPFSILISPRGLLNELEYIFIRRNT